MESEVNFNYTVGMKMPQEIKPKLYRYLHIEDYEITMIPSTKTTSIKHKFTSKLSGAFSIVSKKKLIYYVKQKFKSSELGVCVEFFFDNKVVYHVTH